MCLNKNNILFVCGFVLLSMIACHPQDTITSATQIRFSQDSVYFDTVFTSIGSSTQRIMLYNDSKDPVFIESISSKTTYFQINLDGENQIDLIKHYEIPAQDSIFLFIRACIDPFKQDNPVLIEDTLLFVIDNNVVSLPMQAYGQDVILLKTKEGRTEFPSGYTFHANRPYLIYDTVLVAGKMQIMSGATLYMHNNASIYALGSVEALGEKNAPITIRGDRLDKLFEKVPYKYASGQWGGLYFLHYKGEPIPTYELNHVHLLSGNIGLYCLSEDKDERGILSMRNSKVHNHAMYGVVLQNTDADISNCEISNCAAYCVYLAGGTHTLTHNTIASFFGYPYTTINIHQVMREDVAALYINNLSKQYAPTVANIRNCIITGARENNIALATPLPSYYTGEIIGNYIKSDTLQVPNSRGNIYAQKNDSAVFINTHYLYKEYIYYDFHLDSLSPARGIADSIISLSYPMDIENLQRKPHPDAGCYEYLNAY
jgi:hypothetical protein